MQLIIIMIKELRLSPIKEKSNYRSFRIKINIFQLNNSDNQFQHNFSSLQLIVDILFQGCV